MDCLQTLETIDKAHRSRLHPIKLTQLSYSNISSPCMLGHQACSLRKWSLVSPIIRRRNFLLSVIWARLRRGPRQRLSRVRPSNCKFQVSYFRSTNSKHLNSSWELDSRCKISTALRSSFTTCLINKTSLRAPFQVTIKTIAIKVVMHEVVTQPKKEKIHKIPSKPDLFTKFGVRYRTKRTKLTSLSNTNNTL